MQDHAGWVYNVYRASKMKSMGHAGILSVSCWMRRTGTGGPTVTEGKQRLELWRLYLRADLSLSILSWPQLMWEWTRYHPEWDVYCDQTKPEMGDKCSTYGEVRRNRWPWPWWMSGEMDLTCQLTAWSEANDDTAAATWGMERYLMTFWQPYWTVWTQCL